MASQKFVRFEGHFKIGLNDKSNLRLKMSLFDLFSNETLKNVPIRTYRPNVFEQTLNVPIVGSKVL